MVPYFAAQPGNMAFHHFQARPVQQAVVDLEGPRRPDADHEVHHLAGLVPGSVDGNQQRLDAEAVRDDEGIPGW